MRRLTPDEFIQKAKARHGDKYNYSKVTYVYVQEKLPIICPNHGVFHQKPSDHLRGQGCPRCAGKFIDTETFIKRAVQIHGDKYKYTKARYSNSKEKLIITCPKHGDFLQSPSLHFSGRGCARCAGQHQTTGSFISEAKSKHMGKYSYKKVAYINAKTKVCITCPRHGDFFQQPGLHLSGSGCRRCAGTARLTQEEFVAKARSIHGDLYSYQKVVYVSNRTPVVIICKKHGDFQQAPQNHLRLRQGCGKCARVKQADRMRWTLDEFLKKAHEKHGTKYTYDKVNYVDSEAKVTITCPIHGDFQQAPEFHWRRGCGCPRCAGRIIDADTFIKRAVQIHGDKYKYDKVQYVSITKKVVITCKFHGDFLQSPGHHLRGQGCKRCRMPRGESVIESYLKEKGIDYEWEYSPGGLPAKRKLRYDFCVKINGHIGLIEYHGVQHYKPISFGGGASDYEGGLERDRVKAEYAKKNKIPFLVISHEDFDLINSSLADFIAEMRKDRQE